MDSGPRVRNSPTEPESEAARSPRDPHGLSFTGMVLALLVAWISLTPSLLPRGPLFQGIVSGAAAFVGYGIGTLLAAVAFWMVRRRPPRPNGAVWSGLAVLAVAGLGVFVWFARWQRELRTLMEVDGLSWRAYPTIVIVAVIIFAALLLTARAVVWVARAIAGVLGRVLPDRVAVVAACLVVVVGTVGILNGVVADAGMTLLNDVFKNVNNEIGAEIDAPEGPERSGGPGSLVTWESLGRQGRIFVAGGPTAAQPATSSGRPASTPVRVYTGLASAPTPEEEAALAVAELERAGGFQRARGLSPARLRSHHLVDTGIAVPRTGLAARTTRRRRPARDALVPCRDLLSGFRRYGGIGRCPGRPRPHLPRRDRRFLGRHRRACGLERSRHAATARCSDRIGVMWARGVNSADRIRRE